MGPCARTGCRRTGELVVVGIKHSASAGGHVVRWCVPCATGTTPRTKPEMDELLDRARLGDRDVMPIEDTPGPPPSAATRQQDGPARWRDDAG